MAETHQVLFIGGPISGEYRKIEVDEKGELPETKMIQVPGALSLVTYTHVFFGMNSHGKDVVRHAYAYIDGPNPDVPGMLGEALIRQWMRGLIVPPLEEEKIVGLSG